MKKISRRKALNILLTGTTTIAASQILSACQRASDSLDAASQTNPTNTPFSPETGEPVSTDSPPTATQSPVVYPDLVVARNAEPEPLVRAAMAAIGGMERFVPKGGWVIVKPNICTCYYSYEYATTTNPWVVGTLVKLCYEAGAGKVQVMDYPFGGSADQAYKSSGIGEQVEAYGGEMVQMAAFKFKEVTIDNALGLRKVAIYEDVFAADTLIDVPIAKDHGMSRLTLGMKNLMGLITQREQIHRDFGNRLTDLAGKIRPKLTVIDAVRILTANGPTGGDLDDVQKLDTVIVSPDIVAADSYASTLFGLQPEDLDYIRVGAKAGLGRSDLGSLNIQEINLAA
jgi:uncharacterized protein (DUF362 family)